MTVNGEDLAIELADSIARFRKENMSHYPDLPGLIILRAYMWMAISFQIVLPEDTILDMWNWVEGHRVSLETELEALEKMYSQARSLAEEYEDHYRRGEMFSEENDEKVIMAIKKVKESEDYDFQLISGVTNLFHVVLKENRGIDKFQGEEIYDHYSDWLEKAIKKMRGRYEKELFLCRDILKNINRYNHKK